MRLPAAIACVAHQGHVQIRASLRAERHILAQAVLVVATKAHDLVVLLFEQTTEFVVLAVGLGPAEVSVHVLKQELFGDSPRGDVDIVEAPDGYLETRLGGGALRRGTMWRPQPPCTGSARSAASLSGILLWGVKLVTSMTLSHTQSLPS